MVSEWHEKVLGEREGRVHAPTYIKRTFELICWIRRQSSASIINMPMAASRRIVFTPSIAAVRSHSRAKDVGARCAFSGSLCTFTSDNGSGTVLARTSWLRSATTYKSTPSLVGLIYWPYSRSLVPEGGNVLIVLQHIRFLISPACL